MNGWGWPDMNDNGDGFDVDWHRPMIITTPRTACTCQYLSDLKEGGGTAERLVRRSCSKEHASSKEVEH